MSRRPDQSPRPTRRRVLQAGAALALATPWRALAKAPPATLTIGVFTDSHYADRKTAGQRYYRHSLAKLKDCLADWRRVKVDFGIVLGDMVDKGSTVQQELGFVKQIRALYETLKAPRHYVIGNHDVATLSKDQFVDAAGMKAPYYSFDVKGYHCIVLDANYRKDFVPYKAGNFNWTDTWVSPDEQKWLQADLKAGDSPTLVFIHQCLDNEKASTGVKNAPAVRKILEQSGRVVAVLQGHHHPGGYRLIHGIHYLTRKAMVEGPYPKNNAYSVATLTGRTLRLKGFGRQEPFPLPASKD